MLRSIDDIEVELTQAEINAAKIMNLLSKVGIHGMIQRKK